MLHFNLEATSLEESCTPWRNATSDTAVFGDDFTLCEGFPHPLSSLLARIGFCRPAGCSLVLVGYSVQPNRPDSALQLV